MIFIIISIVIIFITINIIFVTLFDSVMIIGIIIKLPYYVLLILTL